MNSSFDYCTLLLVDELFFWLLHSSFSWWTLLLIYELYSYFDWCTFINVLFFSWFTLFKELLFLNVMYSPLWPCFVQCTLLLTDVRFFWLIHSPFDLYTLLLIDLLLFELLNWCTLLLIDVLFFWLMNSSFDWWTLLLINILFLWMMYCSFLYVDAIWLFSCKANPIEEGFN